MIDALLGVFPEHINWAIPGYWVLIVAGVAVCSWLIDKQGPTPRI